MHKLKIIGRILTAKTLLVGVNDGKERTVSIKGDSDDVTYLLAEIAGMLYEETQHKIQAIEDQITEEGRLGELQEFRKQQERRS